MSEQFDKPVISAIIPTYNRRDSLQRLLDSLAQQSVPSDEFEVIIVDDGSEEPSINELNLKYPFKTYWLTQKNQGATTSRNNGALQGQGEVLVFIDDDITVSKPTLQALTNVCLTEAKVVALGVALPCNIDMDNTFSKIAVSVEAGDIAKHATLNGVTGIDECNTQILAVRKSDFFEIGMFQDPTGGWPNWDDVDFGYRAHQMGYRLIRVADASGQHWDRSLSSLNSATQRWFRASVSAVRLFQRYPDLKEHITMFADMIPIEWHGDSPKMLLRKLLRRLTSYKLVLSALSSLFMFLEKNYPSESFLRRLYQSITGGFKYRGFRQGLKQYGPLSITTMRVSVNNDVGEDLLST